MKSACKLAAISTLVLFANPCSVVHSQLEYRSVALSGDPVPGLSQNIEFARFHHIPLQLNSSGHVMFRASLVGEGVSGANVLALFSEGKGNGLKMIARGLDQAHDLPTGVEYSGFIDGTLRLNNQGNVMYAAFLDGVGVTHGNDRALLRERPGAGLEVIARGEMPAPGPDLGLSFHHTFSMGFNNSGQTVFVSSISGDGLDANNNFAMFSDIEGNGLIAIARSGNQAAGMPAGVLYNRLQDTRVRLGNSGSAVFLSAIRGEGVTSSTNQVIYAHHADGPVVVARKGSQAAALAPGVNFGELHNPKINDSGHVAFSSRLTGPGVTHQSSEAIFRDNSGGALELVARKGSQAGGLIAGALYDGFSDDIEFNNLGHVAFTSRLRGRLTTSLNNDAIFSDGGGAGIDVVARRGDQGGGLQDGFVFEEFYPGLRINNSGQVAFRSVLENNGDEIDAIYVTDLDSRLQLVAAVGELFDTNDDPIIEEFRTIQSLPGNFQLNDSGELAFVATFTDGSDGVFVATIPAPSCFGIVGASALLCCRRRR